MNGGENGGVLLQVHHLFDSGSVAGLSEPQLLERFVSRGDEAAFEALVTRHGPMVLGVCRRLLRDPHEIDDAFQATFLVLVRKAGSLRDRRSLGPWLHGVASRVAQRSRSDTARRRGREGHGAAVEASVEPSEPGGGELRAVLDDELRRLPEKYRAPLLLCYLEGRSHEEAARQLHCPVGTVRSRLSRGRERLRARLVRRGLAPSAALLGTGSLAEAGASVPFPLIDSTVRTATRFAAAKWAASGVVSASASTLMKGVLHAMLVSKLKVVAVGLLAVGLSAGGVRLMVQREALAQQTAAPPGTSPPAEEKAAEKIEPDRLDGLWLLTKVFPDLPESGFSNHFLRIQGPRLQWIEVTQDGKTMVKSCQLRRNGRLEPNRFTYKDSSQLDMPLDGGASLYRGTFEVKEDHLRILVTHRPEPVPPTDFTPGKGESFLFLERQAEPLSKRQAVDLLKSTWMSHHGSNPSPEKLGKGADLLVEALAAPEAPAPAVLAYGPRRQPPPEVKPKPTNGDPFGSAVPELLPARKPETVEKPKPLTPPRPASRFESRLKHARAKLANLEELSQRGAVSTVVVETARSEVDSIIDEIETQEESLTDELELLEVQREARQAELGGSVARHSATRRRIQELAVRAGAASGKEFGPSDVSPQVRSMPEYKDLLDTQRLEEADVMLKHAGVEEVVVRIKQAKRRLAQIEPLKALTRRPSPPMFPPVAPPLPAPLNR